MLSRLLLVFAALVAFALPAQAQFGRTQPVYNVEDAPIASVSGKSLSAEEVKSRIIQAAQAREWIVQEVGPGHLTATVRPRTHVAVVDILYSPTLYSIKYKDSTNLLYDGTTIHRNYNKWVKLLEADINVKLNQR
ncbi:hypothetical protein [Oleisolibacter albus]|uniref:hypothetical protein n=1 Tax=Oleisolibacter albus TaxID=2171757 RepID=UPI0019612393|nr:hypothetical protein [Oleisolibacter albus]